MDILQRGRKVTAGSKGSTSRERTEDEARASLAPQRRYIPPTIGERGPNKEVLKAMKKGGKVKAKKPMKKGGMCR